MTMPPTEGKSETPLVDDHEFFIGSDFCDGLVAEEDGDVGPAVVLADFARYLECKLAEAEKEAARRCEAATGWCIRHAESGRWRTLDSLGMPDFTDDESKALCLRLREHADAYAADDPEDVRIVPAPIRPRHRDRRER